MGKRRLTLLLFCDGGGDGGGGEGGSEVVSDGGCCMDVVCVSGDGVDGVPESIVDMESSPFPQPSSKQQQSTAVNHSPMKDRHSSSSGHVETRKSTQKLENVQTVRPVPVNAREQIWFSRQDSTGQEELLKPGTEQFKR